MISNDRRDVGMVPSDTPNKHNEVNTATKTAIAGSAFFIIFPAYHATKKPSRYMHTIAISFSHGSKVDYALLCLDLFRFEWSQRHFYSKHIITIVYSIGDGRQDPRQEGSYPIYKVVKVIVGVLVGFTYAKDIPRRCQHGVHGRTGGREQFNQCSNGNCRQGLLDNVMVRSKVHFPIEL
jgi:hypothetical protein